MSTQETREAAARAWWAHLCHDTATKLLAECETGYGFECPSTHSGPLGGTVQGCLSMWAKWCREDAANAAPVAPDPLAGVVWPGTVWDDAEGVIAMVMIGEESARWPSEEDARRVEHMREEGVGNATIAAHARAQLAREAKAPTHTDLMLPPEAIDAWLEHNPPHVEAAPVAPAMTLEQARAMCREAGDTVVTASGYERPDLALVQTEAWEAMSQADRARLAKALGGLPVSETRATQGRIEGRRLRALGVTPAVLK